MSTPSLAILLRSLALFLTTSAHAQYGYAPQGAAPPPAGQGIAWCACSGQRHCCQPIPTWAWELRVPAWMLRLTAASPAAPQQPTYAGQANYMVTARLCSDGCHDHRDLASMLTYGQLELNYNLLHRLRQRERRPRKWHWPLLTSWPSCSIPLLHPRRLRIGAWAARLATKRTRVRSKRFSCTVSIGGGVHFAITPSLHFFVGRAGRNLQQPERGRIQP